MPAQNSPAQKSPSLGSASKMTVEEVAAEEQKKLEAEEQLNKLRNRINEIRGMIRKTQEIHNERPSRIAETTIANLKTIMLDYLLDEHDLLENI